MQTMPPYPSQRNRPRPSDRIWQGALLLALLWTTIILASGSWAYYNSHQTTLETARIEARASFNNDLMYRHWAASHGGVYVPVTEDTPPNPYLDAPNRDIVTTDGQRLTLINPAYMTRQVHEMARMAYGTRGHITSLNPIRPANAPDAWENAALLAFEKGVQETSSLEVIDGEPVMRYMHVMITEASCLTCHAQQGYELGDVRGGISVQVPMQPYWDAARHNDIGIFFGHSMVWLIGISAVLFGGRRFVSSARREEDFTQKLQRNALRYQQMFHDNRAISLVVEPQTGRIMDANRSASAFYGYTAQHLQSLSITDLRTDPQTDPQALPCPEDPSEGLYAQRHRMASGVIRDVDVFASPLDTEEGQRLYLIIVDATARREAEAQRQQAEEALRRSKAYLESMLDTQNAFVLRTDLNGDYTYVNDTLYQRFTWMYPSREAMLGTPSMVTIIPEDHPKTFEVVKQCFQQPGQAFQVELRKPCEDGSFFWALWDFVALTDAAGDVTEIQCVGIDMTDRKQAADREFELALEKERRGLLTTFIKHAAHEFRTPLSVISSSSYLMLRTRSEDQREHKAGQIEEQVKRITRLVDMLLMMAKLESGGPTISGKALDLNALVEAVGHSSAQAWGDLPMLHQEMTPGLPLVWGDPHHLGDALRQLMDNAYRFTPEDGTISIVTGVEAGDNRVWVDIIDTGMGIEHEALPHVFETFWRQDRAHSTPGFGLGLTIAQKIIEQHNGSIRIDSETGHGTRVRVTLPAAQPQARPLIAHTHTGHAG